MCPVNPVPETIRNINATRRGKPYDAGAVVIEPRVVRSDHRIMLRHPLQFVRVFHAPGDDGICVNRPVRHLMQGFPLSEQEDIATRAKAGVSGCDT